MNPRTQYYSAISMQGAEGRPSSTGSLISVSCPTPVLAYWFCGPCSLVPDSSGSSDPSFHAPSSAGSAEFCLMFNCGAVNLVPSNAKWSPSGLFDEDSARIWFQSTLQAEQTVGRRFCVWVSVLIPPIEAFLVLENVWFRLLVSHY